jgi:hypothetical protein
LVFERGDGENDEGRDEDQEKPVLGKVLTFVIKP